MATDLNLRYIDLSDFIDEIPTEIQGLITDDSANGSTGESTILKQKGVAAEATFESYVSSRYSLPVLTSDGKTPAEVRQCIYTILKYMLYSRRNAVTPEIENQYKMQMGWLKDVAKGNANIAKIKADDTVESDGITPTIDVGTDTTNKREFSKWV